MPPVDESSNLNGASKQCRAEIDHENNVSSNIIRLVHRIQLERLNKRRAHEKEPLKHILHHCQQPPNLLSVLSYRFQNIIAERLSHEGIGDCHEAPRKQVVYNQGCSWL
jgi:hypothetical protein